ncbi:MAG: fused MFS/spermidine synthase [Acidimicrobiales bacterium]
MSPAAIQYAIVTGGLTTLGLQVLVPRLLHPIFGSGTNTTAAVVALALAGLTIGYRWGGQPKVRPTTAMFRTSGAAACWLVALGVLYKLGVGRDVVLQSSWLLPMCALLIGVPSALLGTISPLAIQGLGDGVDSDGNANLTTSTSASVFARGTAANVIGGLASGFILVPFVGLSTSLIGFGVLLASASLLLRSADSNQPDRVLPTAEAEPGAKRSFALAGVAGNRLIIGYLALAFYSGVASIALEVNGSRMLASLFGPTTGLWAALLAVSLSGLALGYRIGGMIAVSDLARALPVVVVCNAVWLVGATWMISLLEPRSSFPFTAILVIAVLAFGPPFVFFGLESQILVGAVWSQRNESMSTSAAAVFAISSLGGIVGALLATVYLIPLLGLSGLIRWFLAGYLAMLAVTWKTWRPFTALLAVLLVFTPLPNWVWRDIDGRLVAQEEGQFQTIRVYTDDLSYLRFHLGPTYESEVDLTSREPRFRYAGVIIGLMGDIEGKRALIVGGAGHALAHAFEARGAEVVEVELDPVVRDVSDDVFGPLDNGTVVQDGRRYITESPDETFDIVIIDAFAGPRYVPPHLTTKEFFDQVDRVLAPGGTMYMNMISTVSGPGSGPFEAVSSTADASFEFSGYVRSGGNIIIVGSRAALPTDVVVPIEPTRSPNTDDLNPMDLLLETAN